MISVVQSLLISIAQNRFSLFIHTYLKYCHIQLLTYNSMTSILVHVKQTYALKPISKANTDLDNWSIFQIDSKQRIGKQFLSIMVSKSMLKSHVRQSNRNISFAFKKFEEDLAFKLRLNNKRDLYGIFGNFALQILQMIECLIAIELQLSMIFFKRLQNFGMQNQSTFKFGYNFPAKLSSSTIFKSQSYENESTLTIADSDNSQREQYTTKNDYKNKWLQTIKEHQSDIVFLQQFNEKFPKKQTPDFTDEQKTFINENNQNNPNQQSFHFDLTQKDLKKNKQNDPCEQFFINLVAYLKNLSSPQGQLTFIYQHLKWNGFETFYEQFMNEDHQWVCTARIYFPQSMVTQQGDYMQRTQTSKNKKKARQLACMHLLKCLYLEYPQVWLMYKHLKDQKKLSIPPLEEPKDDDQLAIIHNRKNYNINKQKIKKLFSHEKSDIRVMMEKISSKAELNTLLQQLPGRITSPRLQKKIVDGMWLVPVKIEYRTAEHIENRIPPKVYEKTVVYHNAKIAEQQAYMQAIIQLYQDNSQLFEKIQSIKIAKKIKDAQKKLPLMRDLCSGKCEDTSRRWLRIIID